MGSNGSKGKAMKSGYPKQEGGEQSYQEHQPSYGQPVQAHQQYLPPGADAVGREHSACQKQFNPGDETYRCIDCEITDDTPGILLFLKRTLLRSQWNNLSNFYNFMSKMF